MSERDEELQRWLRGAASDIVLNVRRGVWHTTEVEQFIADFVQRSERLRESPNVARIEQLQTYAMNLYGTEFGGLIERDKVLAILGKT